MCYKSVLLSSLIFSPVSLPIPCFIRLSPISFAIFFNPPSSFFCSYSLLLPIPSLSLLPSPPFSIIPLLISLSHPSLPPSSPHLLLSSPLVPPPSPFLNNSSTSLIPLPLPYIYLLSLPLSISPIPIPLYKSPIPYIYSPYIYPIPIPLPLYIYLLSYSPFYISYPSSPYRLYISPIPLPLYIYLLSLFPLSLFPFLYLLSLFPYIYLLSLFPYIYLLSLFPFLYLLSLFPFYISYPIPLSISLSSSPLYIAYPSSLYIYIYPIPLPLYIYLLSLFPYIYPIPLPLYISPIPLPLYISLSLFPYLLSLSPIYISPILFPFLYLLSLFPYIFLSLFPLSLFPFLYIYIYLLSLYISYPSPLYLLSLLLYLLSPFYISYPYSLLYRLSPIYRILALFFESFTGFALYSLGLVLACVVMPKSTGPKWNLGRPLALILAFSVVFALFFLRGHSPKIKNRDSGRREESEPVIRTKKQETQRPADDQAVITYIRQHLLRPPATAPYNLTHPEKSHFAQYSSQSQNVYRIFNAKTLVSKHRRAYAIRTSLAASDGGVPFRLTTNSLSDTAVPDLPLSSVLQAVNMTRIDFLSLDVGGSELQVLQTIPWERVKIRLMCVKANKVPGGPTFLSQFMETQGYASLGLTENDVWFAFL
ncbi:hypothetical protein C7M84_022652 [Penaeus vannamei]|uniref:Methyltransferase FkbM domain-containing protein n=1 Tax=Penaeus vannamei TaxID=6689 RepID=A0A3R7QMU8_PENVA|nr:hypothetical protein C7M84_022652 [Penaeus vannamei]